MLMYLSIIERINFSIGKMSVDGIETLKKKTHGDHREELYYTNCLVCGNLKNHLLYLDGRLGRGGGGRRCSYAFVKVYSISILY